MKTKTVTIIILTIILYKCGPSNEESTAKKAQDDSITFELNAVNTARELEERGLKVADSLATIASTEGNSGYAFEQNVELTGILSKSAGGAMEMIDNFYVLELTAPIDVTAPNAEYETQKNVDEIQIGFNSDSVTNPEAFLNSKITVRGDLYGQQTIHDHRSVIMISAVVK
jgi:hypothetical protein